MDAVEGAFFSNKVTSTVLVMALCLYVAACGSTAGSSDSSSSASPTALGTACPSPNEVSLASKVPFNQRNVQTLDVSSGAATAETSCQYSGPGGNVMTIQLDLGGQTQGTFATQMQSESALPNSEVTAVPGLGDAAFATTTDAGPNHAAYLYVLRTPNMVVLDGFSTLGPPSLVAVARLELRLPVT